jgi:hypothetical protein
MTNNQQQTPELCIKCGHGRGLSDNEGGTCEARIVLEQAELGVETTACGCFCEFTFEVCAQCEANARHNEAGGYDELAKECREYCRRGHRAETTDKAVLELKAAEIVEKIFAGYVTHLSVRTAKQLAIEAIGLVLDECAEKRK